MKFSMAKGKKCLNKAKLSFQDIEDRIFERLCSNYYFKDILYPFAVLEKSAETILLGSTKEIISKINYNFILKDTLKEIVASIAGNSHISVDLKVAENEFRSVEERIKKAMSCQEREEEIQIEIEEQRKLGKCNLVRFPIKDNKVRTDLTIERHAIFASNTFKADFRMHEKKVKHHNTGEDLIFRIEIGDPNGQVRGVLKQKHQGFFYKLAQIWAEQNYRIEEEESDKILYGSFELSVYELVKRARNDDAGHHYESVMKLLREMGTIRVNIKKIYEDGTFDCEEFTLLSYSLSTRKFDKNTLTSKPGGFSKILIRFSDFVTTNFLRKNVKSLMLNSYFSLRDKGRKGVAQLLYTMLDYELASKEKYHISLINLSKRLGLTQYRYKSKRREKIEGSIEAVNGAEILDGTCKLAVYFIESTDKKDWILVAKKY